MVIFIWRNLETSQDLCVDTDAGLLKEAMKTMAELVERKTAKMVRKRLKRLTSESDGQSQGENNSFPARITSVRQKLTIIIIYCGHN